MPFLYNPWTVWDAVSLSQFLYYKISTLQADKSLMFYKHSYYMYCTFIGTERRCTVLTNPSPHFPLPFCHLAWSRAISFDVSGPHQCLKILHFLLNSESFPGYAQSLVAIPNNFLIRMQHQDNGFGFSSCCPQCWLRCWHSALSSAPWSESIGSCVFFQVLLLSELKDAHKLNQLLFIHIVFLKEYAVGQRI